MGRPSLDLVPKNGELPGHVYCWYEGVCAIAEDREEERGGQPVAEEGWEADPWGREAFDRHKGRLGLGVSLNEVSGSGEGGGEPVA